MMQPNLTNLTNLTLCNISAPSLFSGVPNLLLIPAEFLLCLHLEIFPWNVSAEGDNREKPPCHLCQSLTFLSPVTNLLVQRRLNEMGVQVQSSGPLFQARGRYLQMKLAIHIGIVHWPFLPLTLAFSCLLLQLWKLKSFGFTTGSTCDPGTTSAWWVSFPCGSPAKQEGSLWSSS